MQGLRNYLFTSNSLKKIQRVFFKQVAKSDFGKGVVSVGWHRIRVAGYVQAGEHYDTGMPDLD
jgi:hypothetical protein